MKGAQQAWTMEDFDKGMKWFMWEHRVPGYPEPQFDPPFGYIAEESLNATMDYNLYSTFYDRAIRHYLYPANPKYPGTSVPMHMVKFPFRYEQDLLSYPIEELLKIAKKNKLFDIWWRTNRYVPQVKRRKGFYGTEKLLVWIVYVCIINAMEEETFE